MKSTSLSGTVLLNALFLPLLLLLLPSRVNGAIPDVLVPPIEQPRIPCLSEGNELTINTLFSEGGPSTRVQLCPSAVLHLTGPIFFTAKDQELSTEGYPQDETRAKLICTGDAITAVQGDCRRCARVALLNVQIDGSRTSLGRATPDDKGGPLVILGNNEGQRVERCVLQDPRGWAAVHIREGDNLQCTGAKVEWNDIGPAGEEWVEEYDGPDPEASPLGRPLGDGVSLSCRDSSVSHNTFTDTSDAAVVIYGSPGSNVSYNKVVARSRSQMGGILLVDYGPFEGSYLATVVSHNIIDALGGLIRVGIGIGPPVWSDDLETVLSDGKVSDNVLRGYWMGYGVVAAGVKNFTVVDNVSTARHSGLRGGRCPTEPVENSPPMAFLYNATSSDGEFQADFVDGSVQYVVCIEPESDTDDIFKPSEPIPEPEPEPVYEEPELTPQNSVINDIFDHSKQRIMEALEGVQDQVDALETMKDVWEKAISGKTSNELDSGMIMSALSGLSTRVANLESERRHLRLTIDGLRTELKSLGNNMDHFENRETDVLTEVLSIVKNSAPLPPPPPPTKQKARAPLSPPPPAPLSDQSLRLAREILKRSRLAAAAGRGRSTFGTLVILACLQGVVVGVWWLLFRRRGGFLGFGGARKDIKTI